MHMQTRARGLKFASMAVIVVLTLTGFSTRSSGGTSSSGGSGGSSDGGSGGGCSSSSQDHDTSSSGSTSGLGKSDDYDDDSYDDGYSDRGGSSDSTGSAASPEDGTAELVSCVTAEEPYATVMVTNPNAYEASFEVDVIFEKEGATVTEGSEQVTVPADGTAEVKVYPEDQGVIDSIERCSVEERALWTSN